MLSTILTQLHNTFSLPIDDDYLYEEFGIEKPKDYSQQKKSLAEKKKMELAAPRAALSPCLDSEVESVRI